MLQNDSHRPFVWAIPINVLTDAVPATLLCSKGIPL